MSRDGVRGSETPAFRRGRLRELSSGDGLLSIYIEQREGGIPSRCFAPRFRIEGLSRSARGATLPALLVDVAARS